MVQPATTINSPTAKSSRRWLVLAIAALLALGGGTTAFVRWRFQSPAAEVTQTSVIPEVKTVTALGRLEPQGEAIALAPPATGRSSRVEQLLVKEGDWVQAGQAIAILDSRDRLSAAVDEAEEQVSVAQSKLAQIQAGAKQGEIAAQRAAIARLEAQRQGDIAAQAATVARLQAEVQNAEAEYQRYESLYQSGAISASQRDSKRLVLETARRSLQESQAVLQRIKSTRSPELEEARATLERIAEVRPVDIAAAEAEVKRAIAAVKQAKANLEEAYVKSPQAGTVLYIHTRPGELVSSEGIVELGQTSQMYAIAEVYQSDVNKVRPGQRVRVSSNSLPSELHGIVESVGSQVRRQTIINTDPSENIDARVVEVDVRLDNASSQKAAKFTNLQVKVTIDL